MLMTLIFGQADIKEAIIWKWILHTFEERSSLKINYEKSNIFFFGGTDMNSLIMARVLACASRTFPIKYIGCH